jgi:hypothetical protein
LKPPVTLVLDAGRDPQSRAVAFRLLADEAKRNINRLANGKWETSIMIPSPDSGNEIRIYARSRADLHDSIDRLISGFVDPRTACQLYGYFASLRRRGERGNLEIAGDMISPDGTITNVDAKSEEIN